MFLISYIKCKFSHSSLGKPQVFQRTKRRMVGPPPNKTFSLLSVLYIGILRFHFLSPLFKKKKFKNY